MGYVDENIRNDEIIIMRGEVHKIIYLGAYVFMFFALMFMITAETSGQRWMIAFYILLVFGYCFLKRRTDEIAITDRRIISKIGIFKIEAMELNYDKVESFQVNQGLLGRFLDYGDLIIRGTGGGIIKLKKIATPMKIRTKALEKIEG